LQRQHRYVKNRLNIFFAEMDKGMDTVAYQNKVTVKLVERQRGHQQQEVVIAYFVCKGVVYLKQSAHGFYFDNIL